MLPTSAVALNMRGVTRVMLAVQRHNTLAASQTAQGRDTSSRATSRMTERSSETAGTASGTKGPLRAESRGRGSASARAARGAGGAVRRISLMPFVGAYATFASDEAHGSGQATSHAEQRGAASGTVGCMVLSQVRLQHHGLLAWVGNHGVFTVRDKHMLGRALQEDQLHRQVYSRAATSSTMSRKKATSARAKGKKRGKKGGKSKKRRGGKAGKAPVALVVPANAWWKDAWEDFSKSIDVLVRHNRYDCDCSATSHPRRM